MSSLCTLLHSTWSLWFETCRYFIQASLSTSCFTMHSTGSLVVDIISVCLTLSLPFSLTCCWPHVALCPWNLMRCLHFPSLFHSEEYFCCPLRIRWGQEDYSKPLTATFKLHHHTGYLSSISFSKLFKQIYLPLFFTIVNVASKINNATRTLNTLISISIPQKYFQTASNCCHSFHCFHCKLAVSLSLPRPSELMIEGFTFSTKPAVTIATAEATAREMTQHLAFSVSSLDLTPLQHEKNDRSVKGNGTNT